MSREVKLYLPSHYPKQQEFINSTARYTVVEASTKSGKTVACLAWILELALCNNSNRNYWWIAPIRPQAKIAYTRLRDWLSENPGIAEFHDGDLRITLLPNNANIWFKGSDNPDGLYGEDVYGAVIDEASRCREESWHAVRSTLTATRGPVKIIGNVRGRRNWAYRIARRAESGIDNMAFFKLTAYDAIEGGVLDAAEVEDAKENLPPDVFRELYLAEAADYTSNPFGEDAIQKCISPLTSGPADVIGLDLAKHRDWTAMVGLDSDNRCCIFERWRQGWNITVERIITHLKGFTGTLLVDQTGVGDPVLERIRERAVQEKITATIEGFIFTMSSKQQIMELLVTTIQSGQTTYPDGMIVSELSEFEYEYTRTGVRYSAPTGYTDDCVCALAMANFARSRKPQVTTFGLTRIAKVRAR